MAVGSPTGQLDVLCNNGYKGRVGIYQVMPVSEDIQRLILRDASALDIGEQAEREGVRSCDNRDFTRYDRVSPPSRKCSPSPTNNNYRETAWQQRRHLTKKDAVYEWEGKDRNGSRSAANCEQQARTRSRHRCGAKA